MVWGDQFIITPCEFRPANVPIHPVVVIKMSFLYSVCDDWLLYISVTFTHEPETILQ